MSGGTFGTGLIAVYWLLIPAVVGFNSGRLRRTSRSCPLPPANPELNAARNIWQYLRQNYLGARLFAYYTAILDACLDAWRKLFAEAGRIT